MTRSGLVPSWQRYGPFLVRVDGDPSELQRWRAVILNFGPAPAIGLTIVS